MDGSTVEATWLLMKMIYFSCKPNMVTFATLIWGLCRSDNTIVALQLHEQVVNWNSKYSVTCKPNVAWYGTMIDGLCKDGFINKAKELFLEIKCRGIHANAVIYNSLIHGLCCVGEWEEAKSLYKERLFKNDCVPDALEFFHALEENTKFQITIEIASCLIDVWKPGQDNEKLQIGKAYYHSLSCRLVMISAS
ncbi:hypothetical protein Ddye_000080 [Dipteronia dyeriana]|uniref:Pentatricopeptide repeat-containing protein n=1 Tax=Dipteronia dyeriana TaxID=168575 RepID=A0AAD9XLI9_9ROSI|nr:hypothetical protein Ddye_000080 [Dipteronia dyeriana]